MNNSAFSKDLQKKIDDLKLLKKSVKLGQVSFTSPLLLAPMASICNAPFRLLMEDLGAGGTVSELISAHAIKYKNDRTLNMLKIHENEENIGIQLFGEDAQSLAEASRVAQDYGPKFIDLNMGCPVRKVVTKGGGSALMKSPMEMAKVLNSMKKAITIPLTIKIRMGWDSDQVNADEIIHVAKEEGIEFVAIHGRTRAQQYTGYANWKYIEELSQNVPLPLIGNGDLHCPERTFQRMNDTNCNALMIARGALRNPFIFLESLIPLTERKDYFNAKDYLEVINRLHSYTCQWFDRERTRLVQIRKLIVWFTTGFDNASKFRGYIFKTKDLDECMKETEKYFLSLSHTNKSIDYSQTFMSSGHG